MAGKSVTRWHQDPNVEGGWVETTSEGQDKCDPLPASISGAGQRAHDNDEGDEACLIIGDMEVIFYPSDSLVVIAGTPDTVVPPPPPVSSPFIGSLSSTIPMADNPANPPIAMQTSLADVLRQTWDSIADSLPQELCRQHEVQSSNSHKERQTHPYDAVPSRVCELCKTMMARVKGHVLQSPTLTALHSHQPNVHGDHQVFRMG